MPLKKLEEHIVLPQEKPIRLSDYLPEKLVIITTKKGIKKAIERKQVKVNGQIGHTSNYLTGGEKIELFERASDEKKPNIKLDLEVLFEDEHLAVVNKPSGIVVSGNKKHTLENALSSNLTKSNDPQALSRPEPIHRLDFPTSGLLLIGKTTAAVTALNKLFESKTIEKLYYAVAIGKIEDEGEINSEIKTKKASTKYKVKEFIPSDKYERLNLLELSPATGRKHQLRIHLSEIGHPILGDQSYGVEGKISKGAGLYLHACQLQFEHPFTGEQLKIFKAPPKKFFKIFPSLEV